LLWFLFGQLFPRIGFLAIWARFPHFVFWNHAPSAGPKSGVNGVLLIREEDAILGVTFGERAIGGWAI
jgi:hypothetical protein